MITAFDCTFQKLKLRVIYLIVDFSDVIGIKSILVEKYLLLVVNEEKTLKENKYK